MNGGMVGALKYRKPPFSRCQFPIEITGRGSRSGPKTFNQVRLPSVAFRCLRVYGSASGTGADQ